MRRFVRAVLLVLVVLVPSFSFGGEYIERYERKYARTCSEIQGASKILGTYAVTCKFLEVEDTNVLGMTVIMVALNGSTVQEWQVVRFVEQATRAALRDVHEPQYNDVVVLFQLANTGAIFGLSLKLAAVCQQEARSGAVDFGSCLFSIMKFSK